MIRSTRGRSVSGTEKRWLKVFHTLNEFQARLFAADKALDLGRGGVTRLSALTGLSRTTITKAVEELESGGKLVSPGQGRVRRIGGGRKKVEGVDPGVREGYGIWSGDHLDSARQFSFWAALPSPDDLATSRPSPRD